MCISSNVANHNVKTNFKQSYYNFIRVAMTMIEMKPPPIKNKEAALVQITADQILKDAQIHRPIALRPPVQRIMDEKQLHVYKQEKRRQFQDKLRRQRYNLSIWVRYGQWQQNLKEYTRARSIFQRALQIDYTNKSLWLKYAEMEMKNKFVNHARNVWERAIYYLPRQDQFWFKYSYMEELIGQYKKARDVFERWMEWCPGEKAWMAFIKFQERMGEHQKSKAILYRYLEAFPSLESFIKVAKFEFRNRQKEAARKIFERAIIQLGAQAINESYFLEFGKFQIKLRQYQRARQIFKFGLRHVPKEKAKKLYEAYLNFQKEHGNCNQIDEVVLGERRSIYKNLLVKNPLNYQAWLNLIFLEESLKNIDKVREVYEAAVKQKPPAEEKRFWRRYMYIWYNYAVFEEQIAADFSKAEQIYQRALKIVPHKKFTFSKLWKFYADFCVRCNNLTKARKIYGRSIGMCPKQKCFKNYIELQQKLCQIDRVRQIYQKYCETFANFPAPWIQFASFQFNLEEIERCRQILQMAEQLRIDGVPDADQFIANAQAQMNSMNEQYA